MATAYGYDDSGETNQFIKTLIYGSYFDSDAPISYYLSDEVGVVTAYGDESVSGWAATGADVVFRQAVAEWAKVANMTFVEETDPDAAGLNWTEYLVDNDAADYGAYHYTPNNDGLGGAYNIAYVNSAANVTGGYGLYTMLHEIGHGLGLNHSFETNGETPFPGTGGDPNDAGDNDLSSGLYTVMAYVFKPDVAENFSNSSGYAATPMAFDIAAIQTLYGANMTTATGNDTYLLPGTGDTQYWSCIWDADGTDTVSAVNCDGGAQIDLRAATLLNEVGGGGWLNWQDGTLGGSKVYGGFTIANGVTIENAIGSSFGDNINGNDVANDIMGMDGNDTIFGFDGDDEIEGGNGNDYINGGDGTDLVSYASAGSAVTVSLSIKNAQQNTVGAGSDTLLQVENLEGSAYDDTLIGDNLANLVFGLDGADFINARGGNDTVNGGNGDDVIRGANGNDTLRGFADSDQLEGGDGNDTLEGGAGADFLIGGNGTDTLKGGDGDDIYLIDQDDTVTENAGEGTDQVRMFGFDYTLGENLEVLRIRGGAVDGTGNALDNQLYGSTNNNTLSGLGGNDLIDGKEGLDTLLGGEGNDILVGGTARDTTTGGAGADRHVWRDISEGNANRNFADTITDFSQADGDTISLANIDADQTGGTANDDFAFIGMDAFSGTAGELRFEFDGGDTIVELDVDGDSLRDMSIRLTGNIELTADDFLGVAASSSLGVPTISASPFAEDLATASWLT